MVRKVKKKNANLNSDLNSYLSNARAVLYQLIYQADWELFITCVNDKLVDDGISDVLKSHTIHTL